ncbi:MAG TPA: hypothetical protein VLA42_06235 [Verrucomicrobiae bacterium]|nr:hypothetical protein [Verrucomicrobiae bacterium]
MRRFDETSLVADEQSCTEQLARFFPGVAAVRLPVQVTALRGGTTRLRESSVVEFVGLEHAILISSLPLEFDDKVRLEGSRKTDTADATVVAVQYHGGKKAVAVKFLRGPNHWMMHS